MTRWVVLGWCLTFPASGCGDDDAAGRAAGERDGAASERDGVADVQVTTVTDPIQP